MLRLVFTVCMIQAPDTCEQREMLVYEPMPATACVMGAMPELAVWRQTHPNWRIARWRCEDDGTARRSGGAGQGVGEGAARTPPAAEAELRGTTPIALVQ